MVASLINLDNFVLIGPGSEWFWTAVSGIVLAVTFLAIYRQLRTQGAANALLRIEAVHNRWSSKELTLARLEVALALRDGTLDLTNDQRVNAVVDFFLLLDGLRLQRYLGMTEITEYYGASIYVWWRLLGDQIPELRAAEGDPMLWVGFDHLAEATSRHEHKIGIHREGVEAMPRAALLDAIIERSVLRLRLLNDAESGVIPDVTPAPAARAATADPEPAPATPA